MLYIGFAAWNKNVPRWQRVIAFDDESALLYINVYFQGPLLPSIWVPPGLLTGRKYSAGTHWSTCARSHGQAVPGSMGAAAPVHGSLLSATL
jgi:hypothetical protein